MGCIGSCGERNLAAVGRVSNFNQGSMCCCKLSIDWKFCGEVSGFACNSTVNMRTSAFLCFWLFRQS